MAFQVRIGSGFVDVPSLDREDWIALNDFPVKHILIKVFQQVADHVWEQIRDEISKDKYGAAKECVGYLQALEDFQELLEAGISEALRSEEKNKI